MILSIKDINKEMELAEDVISELGGIIFKKGTNIKISDLEILEAFGVKRIEIEDTKVNIFDNNLEEYEQEQEQENKLDEFKRTYKKSLKTLDNIFMLAQGNAQIPILDLRKALQPLLKEEFIQPKYLLALKFISSDFNKYDSNHALSVGLLSYAIAVWMDLEQGERMQIALAGTLHDVGMSRIPSHIIFNKGNLKIEEYNEIKKHTLYGYQILKDAKGLNESSLLGVLQHHERENGEGYPLNLKGNQINIYAKIIAVVDVFHAMTSRRTYREEYSSFQAIDHLINEGSNKLDQSIVNLLSKKITQLVIGTKVLLNNGQDGHIILLNKEYPTRPAIKVDSSVIDLANEEELFIKKVY